MRFWRVQEEGHSFEETMLHRSSYWGSAVPEELDGLCACDSEAALKNLVEEWFPARNYAGMEVLIFEGLPLEDVGDGWLTEPLAEIEREPLDQFMGRQA